MTYEKSVSDILTKPVNVGPPPVQVPEGAYANSLVNPAAQGITSIPPEPHPQETVTPDVQYVVLFCFDAIRPMECGDRNSRETL